MNEQSKAYWLLHVRLETGYRYEDDVVTGTETGIFHVKIENGAFLRFVPRRLCRIRCYRHGI